MSRQRTPPDPARTEPSGIASRPARLSRPVAWTLLFAAAALLLGRWVPLPAFVAPSVPGYEGIDNRRVLLQYALLIAAVILGPAVATVGSRHSLVRRLTSPRIPALTGRHFSPLWLAGAAAIFAFLFLGPGIARHQIGGHELIHFGYLNEIQHGRLLNVDTRTVYGPLLGYSIYLFMKIVSFSIFGFRLYWNVVAWATLVILFHLMLRRMGRRWLLVPCFLYLTLFTTAHFYLPGHDGLHGGHWGWGNVLRHTWVIMLLLAAGAAWSRRAPPWPQALAGAGVVLGTFYAQETGPPAAVAVIALIVVTALASPGGRLRRDLLFFSGGAAVALAAIMSPALLRGRGLEFLEATFEAPGLLIQGAGNLPYPSLGGQGHIFSGIDFYLVPGLMLLLLHLAWSQWLEGDAAPGPDLPIALYGALSFVSVLVRADESHLLNVTAAPIIGAFLQLDRGLARLDAAPAQPGRSAAHRRPAWRWYARRTALPATLLLVLLPAVVPGHRLGELATGAFARIGAWNSAPGPGWIHLGDPRGQVWVPAEDWYDAGMTAKRDSPAASEVIRRLAAGRPVYIVGRKASLQYFLSDTPCCVPFTDLWTTCWTVADQKTLDGMLAADPPPYVFVEEEYATESVSRGHGAPGYHSLGLHDGLFVFQRDDLTDRVPSESH